MWPHRMHPVERGTSSHTHAHMHTHTHTHTHTRTVYTNKHCMKMPCTHTIFTLLSIIKGRGKPLHKNAQLDYRKSRHQSMCIQNGAYTHVHVCKYTSHMQACTHVPIFWWLDICLSKVWLFGNCLQALSAPSVWDYNYFVVCCHPDPLLHPPDTTTPLLARYLLIKIWLPGNRLQTHMHAHKHTNTHTQLHIKVHLAHLLGTGEKDSLVHSSSVSRGSVEMIVNGNKNSNSLLSVFLSIQCGMILRT